MCPNTGVEMLVPDFKGVPEHVQKVIDAKPEVFAHNLETVPRIFRQIRPAFRYERSLDVITQAKEGGMVTKSNLILGMGETDDEIYEALCDLHDAGCDIITLTQYLRPGPLFHPIERWVKPQDVYKRQVSTLFCSPSRWARCATTRTASFPVSSRVSLAC